MNVSLLQQRRHTEIKEPSIPANNNYIVVHKLNELM